MDELTNNEISEYLSDLPESVISVIQNKTWGKRVDEISLKYSLNESQGYTLKNLILFVIIGVEDANLLAQSIEEELGISNLLTEQIIKDVDERVFQYVVGQIEESNKSLEVSRNPVVEKTVDAEPEKVRIDKLKVSDPKETHTDFDVVRSMSKDIEYLKNGQDPVMHTAINKESVPEKVEEKNVEQPVVENKIIPEIRPDISPVGESVKQVEKVQPNNVPHNLPGMEIEENTAQAVVPQVKIDDLGDDKVFVGSEFIKESETAKENVPQNTEIKPAPPKWGSNINDGSRIEPKVEKIPEEVKISVPKYTADPYREPIE